MTRELEGSWIECESCDIHKSMRAEFFCKTHNAVGCCLCKLFFHFKCSVNDIPDINLTAEKMAKDKDLSYKSKDTEMKWTSKEKSKKLQQTMLGQTRLLSMQASKREYSGRLVYNEETPDVGVDNKTRQDQADRCDSQKSETGGNDDLEAVIISDNSGRPGEDDHTIFEIPSLCQSQSYLKTDSDEFDRAMCTLHIFADHIVLCSFSLPKHKKEKAPICMLDQNELNILWKEKNKREVIYDECEKICKYIESMSNSIMHVWPAYETNAKNDIVFVVLIKNSEGKIQIENTLKNISYNIFVTNADPSNKESEQVIHKLDKLQTKHCHQEEYIGNVINNHSDRLLSSHQYLSAITGSIVKSKNFKMGPTEHSVFFQPCIVLYVLAKGKIPLHEDPFETEIEGIPVDVREGAFNRTTWQPSTKHSKPVKMGCQITSNVNNQSFGTLGGFFYHKDLGVCGITCAHVLLNEEMMNELRGEKKVWRNEESPKAFHPNITKAKYYLGPVKEAVYKTGSENSSGIDAAIFKIEGRAPDSGYFPDEQSMCFETGRTLGTAGLQLNQHVVKYGRTTGPTKGYIEFLNGTVREITYERRYTVGHDQHTFLLKNQIQVRPDLNSSRITFNEFGDSGAFVFVVDYENQLACIGMCVGKLNQFGVVIPISAITEELGFSNFLDFRWKHLSEKLKDMDEKLDKILRRLSSN